MPNMHTAPVNDTDGSLATCLLLQGGWGGRSLGGIFFMSVAICWMVELIARGY